MANFCKQCSIEIWGEDTRDLAGITDEKTWAEGKAAVVICEDCGFIQVDPDGSCISDDCLKQHGKTMTPK